MMPTSTRRTFLLAASAAAVVPWPALAAAGDPFQPLERSSGGRLGVAALDTGSGRRVGHRAGERFPFCSTCKLLIVSAILKRSETDTGLLDRRIAYGKDRLVSYSPITSQHAGEGMAMADICAAALQYSDNTAANLMIDLLGGPEAVTRYAHSIGDEMFRLDRRETALNTAIPGDPRDTTSPVAMLRDLERLVLGDALDAANRDRLVAWMKGNTTGDKRIRAGVPAGWIVADKTGTGDYGATNDVAVLYPPGRAPILMAIYLAQRDPKAKARDDVLAAAAKLAVEALAQI